MIHDPFASALFARAVTRIAALLLLGAVLVLVAERRRLRRPRTLTDSVLFRRVASWAVMAPTFLLSVLCGGAVALGLVLLLTVQALREFSNVTGLGREARRLLLALGCAAVVATALVPAVFAVLPLAGFLVLAAATIARDQVEDAWRELTVELFGFLWLPVTLSLLTVIARGDADGPGLLLAVGVGVALSDVAAFTVGSLVGGRRLAPGISPNKTVAGALGNLAGAAAGIAVMAFALPPGWPAAVVALLVVGIAGAAVVGDLIESLVKRSFGVKDAGTILPGFGGILDRIDSLLVALPVTWALVRLAG